MQDKKTEIYILCAGKGARWQSYGSVLKQNMVFGGEALCVRTLRLMAEITDIKPILVMPPHLKNKNYVQIENLERQSETILETILMILAQNKNATALFLLGDVFFSKNTLAQIFEKKAGRGMQIYGRPWESLYSLKKHPEIFAIAFDQKSKNYEKSLSVLREAHEGCLKADNPLERGKIWNFYDRYKNWPLCSRLFDRADFTVIDDETEDFDSPAEYEANKMRYDLLYRPKISMKYFIFCRCANRVRRIIGAAIRKILGLKRQRMKG